MNTELYDKLFNRMDELGAIRKDLSLGCEVNFGGFSSNTYISEDEILGIVSFSDKDLIGTNKKVQIKNSRPSQILSIIGHPPILSDVIGQILLLGRFTVSNKKNDSEQKEILNNICFHWDPRYEFLKDQSDELGEYLLELLK